MNQPRYKPAIMLFADFVEGLEAYMTPEEIAELNKWRGLYKKKAEEHYATLRKKGK